MRCFGFVARPSGDFAPAGDLLFAPPKSRQKALPCETARHSRVPCDARNPGPHPTHFATLRSNKGVRSQLLMRAARAPRASALLGGLEGEAPNSQQPQQPTAKLGSRSHRGSSLTPFSAAEQRKSLRACAQRTSRTDSARLSEQSVAARVPGGPSSSEQRRAPAAKRRAVRSGGALWLLSGGPESDSPAGAKSRHRTHASSHSSRSPPSVAIRVPPRWRPGHHRRRASLRLPPPGVQQPRPASRATAVIRHRHIAALSQSGQ